MNLWLVYVYLYVKVCLLFPQQCISQVVVFIQGSHLNKRSSQVCGVGKLTDKSGRLVEGLTSQYQQNAKWTILSSPAIQLDICPAIPCGQLRAFSIKATVIKPHCSDVPLSLGRIWQLCIMRARFPQALSSRGEL